MTEHHKQWVGTVFDRGASQYGEGSGSFFSYFGKQLVKHVPVVTTWQVLDVATGKGAVLLPLAEKVGPSGKVIGIDISKQMLVETLSTIQKRDIDWVELFHMDAEELNFPDNSFDAIFCGFALFFFPSMSKALSECKRVLKPNGFLAVSTWGDDSKLDELVHSEMNNLCKTASLIVNPLWNMQALQNTLEMADFKNIKIIEETIAFLHHSKEDWWKSLWTHATRATFEQLTPEQLSHLHENVMKKATTLEQENGLREELQVFYGIARNNK